MVLASQAAAALVLAVASDRDTAEDVESVLPVPDVGVLDPVLWNATVQLFAYHVADAKGGAIDKPRNLAKSVTVE